MSWNGFEKKKARPKVSVIIPCYNHGHYLRSALESVLAQKYSNLEVVVVDDGSNDDTRQVAAEFPHVNYIRQSHRGTSIARNTGIENSSANLIAFLDADDLWLPGKLHAQVKYLMANPDSGLVYSPVRILDKSGVVKRRTKRYHRLPTFEKLLMSNTVSTSTVMVRKSCFEEVGLFDPELKKGQDWEMWLRIASMFRISLLGKALGLFRNHRDAMERDHYSLVEIQLTSIKKIREFTQMRGLRISPRIFNQAVAARYIQVGLNCLEVGDCATFEVLFEEGMNRAEKVHARIWLRLLAICLRHGRLGPGGARVLLGRVVGYRMLRAPIDRGDGAAVSCLKGVGHERISS